MLPAGATAGASLSERLIGRGSAAKGATGAATSAEPSRTMSLAAGKRWLGLGRGKGPSRFGVKLDEARLGDDGVPEVLQELRTLLMARKGHRTEGIFRVSPATSALQATQHRTARTARGAAGPPGRPTRGVAHKVRRLARWSRRGKPPRSATLSR